MIDHQPIYIDCEFDTGTDTLISIALVSDASEWYTRMYMRDANQFHPWVKQNVLPLISGEPFMMWETAAVQCGAWLDLFSHPRIVADWPADIAWLCRLLDIGDGRRYGPRSMSMEIRGDLDTSGSEIPHHALHDARALRRMASRD